MVSNEDKVLNEEQIDEVVALGQNLIAQILDRKPVEIVQGLVDAGAPLWFQEDDGTSALHAAAYVENEKLVRYLIEQGAIWNAGTSSHPSFRCPKHLLNDP